MIEPGNALAAMRQTAPLVQNITNFVAMNVVANAQLAAGASPAMVHAGEEAAEFTGLAQALTVNIGTPDAAWGASMEAAAAVASERGTPWVLDPVAVGATRFRSELVVRLAAIGPSVIRGNASEILAMAGSAAQGRGVDAGDAVQVAEAAARELAAITGGIVAVSGESDFVTDGTREAHVGNGHAMMPRVTALGCALTGIVGAFVAAGPAYESCVAAFAYFGLAGERAAEKAAGPGSFQVQFLDALYALTPEDVNAGARISA